MSGGNSALSGANGNTELGEEQIKGEELPSVWSTLKNFDLKKSLEQSPCMRRGLLSGMVAGFAVGGIQYARTQNTLRSCNYAVGFFVAFSLVTFETCLYQLKQGALDQKQLLEVLNNQKRAKEEEMRMKRNKE